ncbi:probable pectinesterase/pectinesterase inhibitor 44 [Vicia villosa]|uniref:probable pectinesterase/pectinesterase inhibitor 44 n=1 Tax=Vicia villosa TaxID=3911 RepID=UPI00273ABBCE|nr:probable pectinesterase/pectinesterase inhibitor 44 [Vicia villosa]
MVTITNFILMVMVFNLCISLVQSVTGHFSFKEEFPKWVERQDKMLLTTDDAHFDMIVAGDGSGKYVKVMDAVSAAPKNSKKRFVIKVKKGIYMENVIIGPDKPKLMIIGEGMDVTVISGNLSHRGNNLTSYDTATFGVDGDGFIARDITFKNTAGPMNEQAVALRSSSEKSIFYRCRIDGYQDSLYAHSLRQFYKECIISGTVDFIFGYAAAVFQNCDILVKKGLPGQYNTIAAQGGEFKPNIPFGFVLQFCNIYADSDLLPVVHSTKTYLGRPWHARSKTVFMQSNISSVVSPEGWSEWAGKPEFSDTLYYAEFKNYGQGAVLKNRIRWRGYHILRDFKEANKFTVAQLISGNTWIPSDVPFTPGFGLGN